MHAVNSTVEVERLYDELRDCIRSNDQDGVQRIMAELVRAKRPLAEIVGEVKRLTRGGARSEPEPSKSDDWPHPSTRPQSVEPAPKAAPGPSYTDFSGPSTPVASLPSPASTTAIYREPERDAGALREWPPADVLPNPNPSRAEPGSQSLDGATAFDLRGYPKIGTVSAMSDAGPSENTWAKEWVEPNPLSGPEQSTPEPSDQYFEPAIELGAAAPVVAAAIAEGEGPPAASDPAPQQSGPVHPEHDTPGIPPQISGRAIALGVGLESAEEADGTQPKHRARRLGAPLAAALVVILVLAGGGAFFLVRPAGEKVADKPNPSAVAAEEPVTKPAPTEGNAAATPPSRGASERSSGLAATALLPAPAAPSPQAATAAPGSPAPAKPETPPAVASLEPSNGAPPETPAVPDVTAPAASPVPVVPSEPPLPAQPHPSSLETASLLERGDRLFGAGDVTSARLFYERAADAGDGYAALRLGETFDPHFLDRAQLRAVRGDPAAAVFWYRRARELGVAEAEILLKGIQTK